MTAPREWRVGVTHCVGDHESTPVYDSDGLEVACCRAFDTGEREMVFENACLIAAAPILAAERDALRQVNAYLKDEIRRANRNDAAFQSIYAAVRDERDALRAQVAQLAEAAQMMLDRAEPTKHAQEFYDTGSCNSAACEYCAAREALARVTA